MPLVDTHVHLTDSRFDEDREDVIVRALEVLDWFVLIGESMENAEAVMKVVRERIYAAVGIHPYHAAEMDDAAEARLREWVKHPRVAALGEMGLDYYNEFTPRAVQQPAFERQLALAAELDMPIAIHNREADDDCHAMLKPWVDKLPGVIMHCFGSDSTWAKRFVDLGCYVSFAGNVTFKKAQPLRDAVAVVPLDRLLVETDGPYLAPVPMRGKRCEPQFVQHTAAVLAEVKGVSPEELGDCTTRNARAVYRVAE